MNKAEFYSEMYKKLSFLPASEVDDRLDYYEEMIDDYMEDGMSEEEAIGKLGSVSDIASQIVADLPISTIVKGKVKKNRGLKTWEMVLLVLGAPVWFSLLIAVLAIIFSVYISLWAVIVSLWAAFVSVVCCVIGTFVGGLLLIFASNSLQGLVMMSAAAICIGLSIFFFFGCKAITKCILLLTKKFVLFIKGKLVKKEIA